MSGTIADRRPVPGRVLAFPKVRRIAGPPAGSAPHCAELGVTTNFSFLRGASDPEELVIAARILGLSGIGIADRNSVAGVVRAHAQMRALAEMEDNHRTNPELTPPAFAELFARPPRPFHLAVGARLVFDDAATPDILVYPRDRAAWGRLTRLLSRGRARAGKAECLLGLTDLLDFAEGQNLVVMPPRRLSAKALTALLRRLTPCGADSVSLAASMIYRGDDARRLAQLQDITADAFVPLLATNDVLYHLPERRPLQDVVTCIREHRTLADAGRLLELNAERHLKSPAEMARLFERAPEAIAATVHVLERCRFSLDELKGTPYADETRLNHATPQDALVAFAEEGFQRRFPNGAPDKIRKALDAELRIIGELDYAPFFLTVDEIVKFARSLDPPILCQGRGSAANSVICYCLGITDVSPLAVDLLFERFVSAERREPPDIDVDFEHERREEVIQHIYKIYGRDRAGLAATVIRYRGRSALREVAKAFGLSADTIDILTRTLWGWSPRGVSEAEARRIGLDPSDPRLAQVLALADELIGTPRHLSQHVGGFVITRDRLDEVVPIENAAMEDRTIIEWEKNDLETLCLLKVDVLALGMLTALRRGFAFLQSHYRQSRDLSIQDEKPEVYAMIQRADTLGTFQIESRAQMSMLPRLKPKEFYDLVIEVAIVRPGPIQGNMVHPYLRRREGCETVTYPKEELRSILHKTMGVPLFQEQAMRIAIVAAGFEPAEADRLRRAMATFKRVGTIGTFRDKFLAGMAAKDYDPVFAKSCWDQIEGFGGYGFPESHAASFANLVYASCWLKCRYPDVFAAAILNSQPMGFYAPAQLVRDAQEHGVDVRPVDVNASNWDCTLEPGPAARERLHPRHRSMADAIQSTHALRLGMRQVSGFSEADAKTIESVRAAGFDSIRDLWLRTGLKPHALETLAEADAFGSLGLDRREALWAIKGLRRTGDKDDLPLFARASMPALEPDAHLPPMPPGEEVIEDYRHLHLSLKAHPVSFLRAEFSARGILRHEQLPDIAAGRRVTVGGLVLVRQRPGSAKGVIFMTLEDETAIANTIVWPTVFERFRPVVLGSRVVSVTGRLQNAKGVIHVVAEEVRDLTFMLGRLSEHGATIDPTSPTDEAKRPVPTRQRHPRAGDALVTMFREQAASPSPEAETARAAKVMPKGRNFH